jgi:hypothetical protein
LLLLETEVVRGHSLPGTSSARRTTLIAKKLYEETTETTLMRYKVAVITVVSSVRSLTALDIISREVRTLIAENLYRETT